MQASPAPEATSKPSLPETRISGPLLTLAQRAWPLAVAMVLGLNIINIPHAFAVYTRTCSELECASFLYRLTPTKLEQLLAAGFSAAFFAAYTVAIQMAYLLVYTSIASIIFVRKSDDRMGLLVGTFLLFFGCTSSAVIEGIDTRVPVLAFPVACIRYLGQVLLFVFFFLFPDGKFVPRWTIWIVLCCSLLYIPEYFFPASGLVFTTNLVVFAFYLVTGLGSQIYRYVRVSTPTQRQQTKWVTYAVTVAILGFGLLISSEGFVMGTTGQNVFVQMAVNAGFYSFFALIPVSIAIAIIRSRLYDIDVLLNRTLVYGLLTGTLALLYFGSVVVLQQVFSSLLHLGSELAVVMSTLGSAAVFNPLRRRIQRFIDRRFYRSKYNAERILAAFSRGLRNEVDPDVLSNEIVQVVEETLRPSHVSLWLREPHRRPPE